MHLTRLRQLSLVGLLAVMRVATAQAPVDGPPVQPIRPMPSATSTTEPQAAPTQLVPGTTATPPPATRTLVLRANSLIPLRFMESVASDANKPGTNFRMQVTDDINVDDAVLIPAGSIAIGEVIDSKPAGAFGKAGALIVSARYLLLGERQIKLHSNLGSAGRSELGAAFLVPFVHGKQAVIAAESEVVAKTARDESFEVPPAAAH
jgi:hypothetical protein